jgi:hypothetical protein
MASEPTYLQTFKEYTKSLPSAEDRETMEMEYYGEGDRACAILQATWTELIVERTLRARLRYDGAAQIFDVNGPLGTFSNKIIMAFGMGIFGTKTRHDLTLIRTLRNGFAHCRLPLRFNTPEVKAVCDHLLLPDVDALRAIPTFLLDHPVHNGGEWHDKDHPRQRYIICCYTIINGLFLLPPGKLEAASELP